jgi:hypothetical protein
MGDLANAVPYAASYDAITPITIRCHSFNLSKAFFSQFDDSRVYLDVPQQCDISSHTEIVLTVTM